MKMKMKKKADNIDTTKINLGLEMETNIVYVKSASVC